MKFKDVKALTFDTGGTILDWHTGFVDALTSVGLDRGIDKDWDSLAKEIRLGSLARVLDQGKDEPPKYNIDQAHRAVLNELLDAHDLDVFTDTDRRSIAYDAPHNFSCWPDFPAVLPKLRTQYMCVSFTILSYRLIIDTARKNGLVWDAVLSCEGIGKYKPLPEAYLTVASHLQLDPEQCCMIACHNFDLDAAKAQGYKTAFVRRPMEWGGAPPAGRDPHPHHDLIVNDFPELAVALGVKL